MHNGWSITPWNKIRITILYNNFWISMFPLYRKEQLRGIQFTKTHLNDNHLSESGIVMGLCKVLWISESTHNFARHFSSLRLSKKKNSKHFFCIYVEFDGSEDFDRECVFCKRFTLSAYIEPYHSVFHLVCGFPQNLQFIFRTPERDFAGKIRLYYKFG